MSRKNAKAVSVMIVLVMTVFCFTGCIRFRTTMNIRGNGKADLALIYAFHKELIEGDVEDELGDVIDALEDEGWTVDDYKKGDYIGYQFTMKDVKVTDFEGTRKQIDKLCADAEVVSGFPCDVVADVKVTDLEEIFNSDAFTDELEMGDFELTKNGSTYTILWDTGISSDTGVEGLSASDLLEYGGFMEVVIVLPSAPKSENASEVSSDGKTLTWNLLEDDEVEVTFTLVNTVLIIVIAAAVFVLMAGAAAVVLVIVLKKKKPAKAKAEPDVPAGPVSSPEPSNPIDFTQPIPEPLPMAPLVSHAYIPEQPAAPAAQPPAAPSDQSK